MRFSVVVPMYQAQDFLQKCLQSIAAQSFGDFEALLVDDGSTDDTYTLAQAFAASDSRFRVIHTDHLGTGAARNTGFASARGDYVLFMDADDAWRCPDLLERLNRQIEAACADVLMFQMVKVTEDGKVLARYTKPRFQQENTVLPLQDVYLDLVRDGQTLASACNKCVRRTLLLTQRILFREDIIGEDIDWVLQVFSHVQTICLLNLDAYNYTQHHSPSRSDHPDAPNDLVTLVREWGAYATGQHAAHPKAVAGLVAFEYGICMGSYHKLRRECKQLLREHVHLLQYGLDKKTKLIAKFHRIFGFSLTCLAIRVYLRLRRIW